MANGKYKKWLEPDSLLLLRAWARDGLTDEMISENIGISRSTLSEWKNRFEDISDALKKGKEVVDIEVENALIKKALGFSYSETTKELVKNPDTDKMELIVTKVVTKEAAPDTTAIIYWLKNRKRDTWQDKPQGSDNNLSDLLKDILSLAEILKKPMPNRELSDYE